MLIYLDIKIPHLQIAHQGGNLEVGNIKVHPIGCLFNFCQHTHDIEKGNLKVSKLSKDCSLCGLFLVIHSLRNFCRNRSNQMLLY